MAEGEITEEDIRKMSPEQLAELQKQNCLFCHLSANKIPSKKVYEDDICFAILDINPGTKGHMLLLPKEHYMMLPQTPEAVIKHLAAVAKKLSRAALVALKAEGTNIFIANGAVAGQKAPHVIIHIIPRYPDDHVTAFDLPEKEIRPEDLANTQKIIAKALGTTVTEPVKQEESKQVEKKTELEEIDLKGIKEIIK